MIAVVGPTASGKSALALRIAEALGAEIVSADSRLVYRGMDIGTAKPTPQERARVPHHCIDLVDPGEAYDAARYRRDALAALEGVAARGRLAVLVGGTGLYVRAVLDGLDLESVPRDPALRARLEALGTNEVFAQLEAVDAEAAAIAKGNRRRAVRYLEIALLGGPVREAQRRGPSLPAVRIGLAPPLADVDAAIERRTRRMVDDGVLDETRALVARGLDPKLPSMTGHGYVHWAAHLAGALPLEEAIARTVRDTRAYARRQMTWFRRDPEIQWADPVRGDPLAGILRRVSA